MNRALLSTTHMTPAERSVGRFMRAPDGHPDSDNSGIGNDGTLQVPDSSGNQNNQGVNSGDSDNDDQNKDNNGQSFDASGFWKEPEPEGTPPPDSGEEGRKVGTELAQMINNAGVVPEIFNRDIAEQIANGDFTKINEVFAESQRNTIKQFIPVMGKLLEVVTSRLEAQFEQRLQGTLKNDKDVTHLETHFPQAKDPAVRPIVERVYKQALQNTKGDRDKAIEQTKGMLAAFGTSMGLTTPPSDPNGGTGGSSSLVDELLGRS